MASPDESGPPIEIFSAKVADYLAGRPGYPPALLDRLTEIGALSATARVADLGAGTGLLTRDLLARAAEVIAVEPDGEMRAAADRLLGGRSGYRSVAGTAEATSLADGSIDLVTAAQAFHWFEPRAVRRETLRILRPAGQVAWIWNERDLGDPFQQALDGLFDTFGGERRAAFQAADDRGKLEAYFGAGPFAEHRVPSEQRLARGQLVALALSRSYMPLRGTPPAAEAEKVAERLFERFQQDGQVTVRYETVAFVGRPG